MANALQLLRGEEYEAFTPKYYPGGLPMEQAPLPPSRDVGPFQDPRYHPDPARQVAEPTQDAAPVRSPSFAELLVDEGAPQGGYVPMEQGAAPMAQSVSARPEQMPQPMPKPGSPDWMTPERRRMYEKAKRAATNYRTAVDARRQRRRQSREYHTLYNQMQNERGKVDQIENMMTTYKDLFRPDDPRTESLIRQQMQHFESAERMNQDLRRRLQKYGVKIDPKGQLPEDPWGADEGDEQFDRFIMQGYNDALTSDPYR